MSRLFPDEIDTQIIEVRNSSPILRTGEKGYRDDLPSEARNPGAADGYLAALVKRELHNADDDPSPDEPASGMIVEVSGLRVYRTGRPIPPAAFTDVQNFAHEKAKSFARSATLGTIYTTEEVLTEYLNYFAGWDFEVKRL